jgi:hypothetical protein
MLTRLIKWLLACAVLASVAAAGLWYALRPSTMERTEIFKGVFLTVEQLPSSEHGGGRVMIAEVHWDTPGVELVHRAYTWPLAPENPAAPHYKLTLPDWSLFKYRPALLVNTTRYDPHGPLDSIPGRPVRSVETVVVDGQPSHVHPHSYLMYWDADKRARLLENKPPDAASLAAAVMGISLQGYQIAGGRPHPHSMDSRADLIDRTFIGFDPTRNILYLLAFEKASGDLMIDRALRAGVMFGGQVDSGSATALLVGYGGAGVRPHTGIRNWRPLGPYLKVIAEPM